MARPPRIKRRKAGGGSAAGRDRGGRPSLDPIDHVMIDAVRRAAELGGLKVSSLILINVRVGLILGASPEATLKRLQAKAKRRRE
jgi:hypothetical protein